MAGDPLLPSQHDDVLSLSESRDNDHNHNNYRSPLVHSTDKDEDFIAELTHHMAHFMLPDDDTFDFSVIGSHNQNSELSWDLMASPQSTLWSPVGSNQESPEGSSQEPSPPATPQEGMIGMFEKMKLDERGNSKYHPGYEIQSSNIGLCSYQSLIQEQIRSIEFSRLKQEQVLSPKHRKSQGQISQQSEPKQIQQIQKKGKGSGSGRRTPPPPRPSPQAQQPTSEGMRTLFLDGSGTRGGTGVFLPRGGGTSAPHKSTNKQGKGCPTVLIPARVVQALQLHFEQIAATSGPKVGGFPPLHDILVSNSHGMYSLQKRQSRKAPANIQSELVLPQEWTY